MYEAYFTLLLACSLTYALTFLIMGVNPLGKMFTQIVLVSIQSDRTSDFSTKMLKKFLVD